MRKYIVLLDDFFFFRRVCARFDDFRRGSIVGEVTRLDITLKSCRHPNKNILPSAINNLNSVMTANVIAQSGVDFMTRLMDRPSVEELDNDLFFKQLNNTDVVELRGTISSRMNLLLTKLIAKCILPKKYNGINMDVLFINTENNFQIAHLVDTLKSEIRDIQGPSNVEPIAKELLDNLKMIYCYNYHQFLVTLNSLDNILMKNKKVGLIVVDSISVFFWQQRDETTKESYNSFVIKLLKILRNIARQFRVVVLYTKKFDFESKKANSEWYEEKKSLRYAISLYRKNNSKELICDIQSGKDKKQMYYKIVENSIVWGENVNKKIIVEC